MESTSGSADAGVRVVLYVRSLAPRESRRTVERVVGRLDELAADGAITGFRVVPTGAELPPTPADAVTEVGEYLLHRIAVFADWARTTDRSLDGLFDRRTVASGFTGETDDAIHMPTMVMAEYSGPALRFVSPCEADGERVSVDARLEALARPDGFDGTEHVSGASRRPPGPTTPAE